MNTTIQITFRVTYVNNVFICNISSFKKVSSILIHITYSFDDKVLIVNLNLSENNQYFTNG